MSCLKAIKRDSDKRVQDGLGLGAGMDPREGAGNVRGVGSNWADAGF